MMVDVSIINNFVGAGDFALAKIGNVTLVIFKNLEHDVRKKETTRHICHVIEK